MEDPIQFGFTEQCGSQCMGQFPKECTSIILTKTLPTTVSPTCIAAHQLSMPASTARILTKSDRSLLGGINPMQEESGIVNTEGMYLETCNCDQSSVANAKRCSKLKTTETSDISALERASQSGDETTRLTTSQKHAAFVVNHLATANMRIELPVLVPVSESRCLSVQRTGKTEPVYNLSTSDGTAVFNGVLSKNCDSLRYGLFTYHGMVGATIDSAKRLNRDVVQDRNDMFPDTSRLSGISTAHRGS